ncbi:UNVERIFIED_CONTAM: hypothetical protein K2H54_038031 [Gekko kuhli]
MDRYTEGLADDVLDELAWVKRPPMLQNLITLCLRIDGRLESQQQAQNSTCVMQAARHPAPWPLLATPAWGNWLGPLTSILLTKTVPIKIQLPDERWLFVYAMLDSGAAHCFIDAAFVKQHQIPVQPKEMLTLVEAINGRLLHSGSVTQETCPLTLYIEQHQEQL